MIDIGINPEFNPNFPRVSAIKKCCPDGVHYIGIAADEPKRFGSFNANKKSPLVEIGWTEKDCYNWCAENALLSPIYKTSTRGGCWFCHNQRVGSLRILRAECLDLWNIMLRWDNALPIFFKIRHTLHDYEKRFAAEDSGLIMPNDKRFRWKQLESLVIP